MSIDDIEKLKRNNYELQEIINNSWDGIGIIDKSTKFIYVNNAFVPILGFDKKELLKTNLISLMKEEQKESFLELLIVEDTSKKYKAETDIVCIRKDKKDVYLKITISTMLNKNLFVINIKDITSQISDDQILDNYVLSIHTDIHGIITKVSSAFLKLSLYEENQIIGKHYSFLAHEDSNKIIYTNIDKSLQNLQEYSGKLKNKKNNGSAFWINMTIKPMFNKYGDVTGYTSLMFDITNEINLNDEASMLQEQVNTAKNEIEEKENLLIEQSKLTIMSETLQRLSHEWRQPLNLISIQAQKLELDYSLDDIPSPDKAMDVLEKIKNEAKALSKTIENFQGFLEPKNKIELTSSKEIIDNAISIFSKKEANLKINYSIENNKSFETYKNELTTVLVNLFYNSYEAIKNNRIEKGFIEVKEYIIADSIYFEVIDNAKGIDNKIIHKVFEPYFSTKEQKHGVGLGLYTSKIIVELHLNGLISIEKSKDGTKVKISFPIK